MTPTTSSFFEGFHEFRYAAYSLGLVRVLRRFRKLIFSSDVGAALSPVVHRHFVLSTFVITFSYCFADIAYEAYQAKHDPHLTQGQQDYKMKQKIVERSLFHGLASITLPEYIIHQSVHHSKHIFQRMNKFTRLGPSIVGIAIIPLFPKLIDDPLEKALEYGFEHYWPKIIAPPVEEGQVSPASSTVSEATNNVKNTFREEK